MTMNSTNFHTLEEETFARRKFREFLYCSQFAKVYCAKVLKLKHLGKFIPTKYENVGYYFDASSKNNQKYRKMPNSFFIYSKFIPAKIC